MVYESRDESVAKVVQYLSKENNVAVCRYMYISRVLGIYVSILQYMH